MSKRSKHIKHQQLDAHKVVRDEAQHFEFHVSYYATQSNQKMLMQLLKKYGDIDGPQARDALAELLDHADAVTYWNHVRKSWTAECQNCTWHAHTHELHTAMDAVSAHLDTALLTLHIVDMRHPDWRPHVDINDTPPAGTTLQ